MAEAEVLPEPPAAQVRRRAGRTTGFRDRRDAGVRLASALRAYRGRPGVLVLAIPRGGVPVGLEVASSLEAPLDVLVVRKLGAPGQEELAMGAIASGGIRILNPEVVGALEISEAQIKAVERREAAELARRERIYRGGTTPLDPTGRTVILVDDGLATGSTMLAAIEALRRQAARSVVVAVPVAPESTCREVALQADDFVCLLRPEWFTGVGAWYLDFSATSDDEVRHCLAAARRRLPA